MEGGEAYVSGERREAALRKIRGGLRQKRGAAHSGGGDADRLASDHRGLPGSRGRAQHAFHFGNAGLPRGKAGAGSAAGRLARRGSRDAGAALQAPALLHLPARPAHRPLWPGAGQLPRRLRDRPAPHRPALKGPAGAGRADTRGARHDRVRGRAPARRGRLSGLSQRRGHGKRDDGRGAGAGANHHT